MKTRQTKSSRCLHPVCSGVDELRGQIDDLKSIIVAKTATNNSLHAEVLQLRAKLEEWLKPCFCEGHAGKCLMCETRELLHPPNDKLSHTAPTTT